jgi:hypothetical protein
MPLSAKSLKRRRDEGGITSKELTRVQLYKYLFGDFVKGLFIFSSLFFDLLIVSQLYNFIPDSRSINSVISIYLYNSNLFLLYVLTVTVVLETILVIVEIGVYLGPLRRFLTIEVKH